MFFQQALIYDHIIFADDILRYRFTILMV